MSENDSIIGVRLQLAEIKGMLTRAHTDYDRRLETLEKNQAGALGRVTLVLSPIIGSLALLVAMFK